MFVIYSTFDQIAHKRMYTAKNLRTQKRTYWQLNFNQLLSELSADPCKIKLPANQEFAYEHMTIINYYINNELLTVRETQQKHPELFV